MLPIEQQGHRLSTRFNLPSQADPNTVTITLAQESPFSITDIAWEKTMAPETDQMAGLREQLDELQKQKSGLETTIKSRKIGALFWENQAGFQADTGADMADLAGIITTSLEQAYSAIEKDQQQLEKVVSRIEEIKSRMEQIAGPDNMVWKARILLDGPGNVRQLEVAYSYILGNSGWSSFYRLEARPGQDLVEFSWDAEVWQTSGTDWDNVQMSLATLEPQRKLDPRPLPEWIVGPRQVLGPMVRTMDMARKSEPALMAMESQPILERTGTFSQWRLGPRSLAAGEKSRFNIQQEDWPARFTHLLRPSLGNSAFIRAAVEFELGGDYPGGQALFFLERALTGKKWFSLTGTEETLFFGQDPFVSAELITREKKSGAAGFRGNRQTYLWDFVIGLENNHSYPVDLRVEEPRPVISDERVNASFDFRPEPTEKTQDMFIWELPLEPGQEAEIHIRINMQAPKDMDMDWGWRR